MKMHHIRASRPLVEIVDVLGDDSDFKDILKLVKSFVSGVWLNSLDALAAFIVEPQHSYWIPLPSLRGRYKRNGLSLPQTSRPAKGVEPTFSAYSRSGKNHNVSISH
jgi:hypothetical protein